MKFFLLIPTLLIAAAASAQYKVVKCLSGDCQAGTGEATVQIPGENHDYQYKGTFKDGLPDGTGILMDNGSIERYSGTFKAGVKKGMGFSANYSGTKITDGSAYTFQNHEDNNDYVELVVEKEGKAYANRIKGRHSKHDIEVNDKELVAYADEWLKTNGMKSYTELVTGTRQQKADDEAERKNNVVSRQSLQVPHDSWVECYNGTLVTGRNYYPNYDSRTKVPFVDCVFSFKITATDGTVIRDGEEDWGETYPLNPPATGVYRILVKFHQNPGLGDKYATSIANMIMVIRYKAIK